MIRPVKQQDISFMADIYNEYVVHGTATFEEVPLTEEEMSRRIIDTSSRFPCLVCEMRREWLVIVMPTCGKDMGPINIRWKRRSTCRRII